MTKKFLAGTSILIIFFFLILLLTNRQTIGNLNNLRKITLKNILIQGENYNLDNGKIYEGDKELFWFILSQSENVSQVVSLAGFYIWNKEDPLLTSPDFDAKNFEESIKVLEKESRSFQKDTELKKDIFPIQFLYSVIKVNNANNTFLKNPSRENALNLIKAQKQAVGYYKNDIGERIKLIEPTIKDNNRGENILYFQLATNPAIILNDYKKLLENAQSLEKELAEREKCLNGQIICKRPSDEFENLKTAIPPESGLKILDDETLNVDYPTPNLTKTGPFAVTTPCLGLNDNLEGQKQAYFLFSGYRSYPQVLGNESIYTRTASEVFFRQVGETIVKDRIYREKGISTWAPISGAATYACPDLSYLAKLATINSYMKKLEKNPLFKNIPLTGDEKKDEIIKNGQALEELLIKEKIKDYDALSSLGNLYLKFYRENPSQDIFLNYGLGIQRNLTEFPLIFNSMIQEFMSFSIYQRLDNIDSSNLYLYGIRNIPSFSYLTFSKSFFRLNQDLEGYQRRNVKNIGFDKRYLTYSLALTAYSKDEIKSWFNNVGHDIYESYLDYEKNSLTK